MDRIEKKGEANPLEQQVAAALTDIVNSSEDAQRAALSNLKITGVKDVEKDGVRVYIVSVPYKQIALYHGADADLVPELEKKLGNVQAIIVAKRRAFPKRPVRGRPCRAIRATGRTLRSVQDALLDDVVYPTAIVGKRTHYDAAGKQVLHIFLDAHDRTQAEERLSAFAVAYTRLTGRKTVFQFGAA
jgi:small subunit ribosomal protein S7e